LRSPAITRRCGRWPTFNDDGADALWPAHPPELADRPPMQALRAWMQAELAASLRALREAPPGAG
jgi:hypothetical protein